LRDYNKRLWSEDLTTTRPLFNKRKLQAQPTYLR
jgi:hypothetical protein